MKDKTPFAYDLKLLRPGCVLLQAAMGGDYIVANRFPTESWLLAPTPDLRVYNIPNDELEKAVELAWLMAKRGSFKCQ